MAEAVFGVTAKVTDFYELGARLGQPGQFGYAREAILKETGEKRACKVISKSKFPLSAQRRAFFQQMRNEIDIMRRLRHANIVSFYEVFEDDMCVYIVMEFCGGGELFDRIQERGSYTERDAANVLRQIVSALHYMHENNTAHCDLKPDNFLFLNNEDEPVKIIDFGMSKIVQSRKYFTKFCGTPYYVAPEVIEGHYNEACDMWSVGVVMFVMLFGYPPFYVDPSENHADAKILKKVKRGFCAETRPNYGAWFPQAIPCSDAAKDLISKLLVSNVADRLTAEEALRHPWMIPDGAPDTPIAPEVLDSLKNFTETCKFKEAVLRVMVEELTEDQVQSLKDTFKRIDTDNDGVINMHELREAVSSSDPRLSESDVAQMMAKVDLNGDGVISYDELCAATVSRKLVAKEERLWKAFRRLDKDNDGKISVTELKEAIGADDLDAAELIREADVNGDGQVDYDEFLQMFDQKNFGSSDPELSTPPPDTA